MRDQDMLDVVIGDLALLDFKKREFVKSLMWYRGNRSQKKRPLTDAQHSYLTACYDKVVAAQYGLEAMSTDRETAARRAISRARSGRGK